MTEINNAVTPDPRSMIEQRIELIDQSIDIMDRHASELTVAEAGVVEQMRKWDREYKDDRLHSTPRPMKHVR
jgi:hypothetical protein